MTWVWENSKAGGTDRLVMLAIADAAHDNGGGAYPAIATLARKTLVDTRTVQRSIRRLIELGEVRIDEEGGGRRANVYRIVMKAEGRQNATPPEAEDEGDVSPQEGPSATPALAERHPSPGQDATLTVLDPSYTHQEPKSEPPASDAGPKRDADDEPTPVVVELCALLADRIEQNGSKRPTVGKAWFTACRLMIDLDKREPEKIRNAIEWCQKDEFWRANILSMPKLREKYDQLRLAATRPAAPRRDEPMTGRQRLEASRERQRLLG